MVYLAFWEGVYGIGFCTWYWNGVFVISDENLDSSRDELETKQSLLLALRKIECRVEKTAALCGSWIAYVTNMSYGKCYKLIFVEVFYSFRMFFSPCT